MKKAFTLIELVIVIALISILAVTLAPRVLSQINKSKVSRVLQELSDLRRDIDIKKIETNENIDTVDKLNDLLSFEYTTLQATNIPESKIIYSERTNRGGWVFDGTTGVIYANLPNGAYTGDEINEIWDGDTTLIAQGVSESYRNVEDGNSDQNDYVDPLLETGEKDDTIEVEDDVSGNVEIITNGGDDTIIVGDDVQAGAFIDTGDGNDTISIGDVLQEDAKVETGSGDDTVIIGNDIEDGSSVDTGKGDDSIIVKDDVENNASINTGEGNDSVVIEEDLENNATVDTGDGDDNIIVNKINDSSTLNAGDGDDNVTINDVSRTFDDGKVDLGSGNDTLTVDDSLKGSDGIFDGGEGSNTLILKGITKEQWDDNENNVQEKFQNFDNIIFE